MKYWKGLNAATYNNKYKIQLNNLIEKKNIHIYI